MNCETLLELYTDYLAGAMSDEQRAQVDTHLRGCTKCADDFKFFQSLVAETRALEPAPVPLSLRSNVRAALSQRPPSWGERFLQFWRRPATLSLAGVTACVLLVAVAVQHNQSPSALPTLGRGQVAAPPKTQGAPDTKPPTPELQAEHPVLPLEKTKLRRVDKLERAEQSDAKRVAGPAPAKPTAAELSGKAQAARRDAFHYSDSGAKATANLETLGGNTKGGGLAVGLSGGGGGGAGGPAAPVGGQSNADNTTLALKRDGAVTQSLAKPTGPGARGKAPEGKPSALDDRNKEPVFALSMPAAPQRGAGLSRTESAAGGMKKDDNEGMRKATVAAGTNTATPLPAPVMRAGADATRAVAQQMREKEKQSSLSYITGREVQLMPVDEESRANYKLGQVGEGNSVRYNRQPPGQSQSANTRSQAKSGVNVSASVRGALEVGESATLTAEVQSSVRILDATIQIEAPNEIEFISGNSTAKGTVTLWSGTMLPNDPTPMTVSFHPLANGKHLLSFIIRSEERGVLARRTFTLPVGAENQLPRAGLAPAARKK